MYRQQNKTFTMNDLDNILMGLYLNIDNAALENCQTIIDRKMMEVCGSTTDCNKFAADDTIGTGSLRPQKSGNIYRITGMISFGQILMGDHNNKQAIDSDGKTRTLKPGEVDVDTYLASVQKNNTERHRGRSANSPEARADADIIGNIEAELMNIAGTINRTIEIISGDPHIEACVNGRDLAQVTGQNRTTVARFPKLLNNTRMIIAASALRQAQTNYNTKFNEAVATATADASLDLAQFMCQKIAESGVGSVSEASSDSALVEPYAIAFEIGAGLTNDDLLKGGAGVAKIGGVNFKSKSAIGRISLDGGGATRNVTALFNRTDRICRICTTTTMEHCSTSGSASWFHNSKNAKCTVESLPEQCDQVKM